MANSVPVLTGGVNVTPDGGFVVLKLDTNQGPMHLAVQGPNGAAHLIAALAVGMNPPSQRFQFGGRLNQLTIQRLDLAKTASGSDLALNLTMRGGGILSVSLEKDQARELLNKLQTALGPAPSASPPGKPN